MRKKNLVFFRWKIKSLKRRRRRKNHFMANGQIFSSSSSPFHLGRDIWPRTMCWFSSLKIICEMNLKDSDLWKTAGGVTRILKRFRKDQGSAIRTFGRRERDPGSNESSSNFRKTTSVLFSKNVRRSNILANWKPTRIVFSSVVNRMKWHSVSSLNVSKTIKITRRCLSIVFTFCSAVKSREKKRRTVLNVGCDRYL